MGSAVAKALPVVAGAAIGFAVGGPAGMSYGAAIGGAGGSAARGGDLSQIIQGGMYGYGAGSLAGAGATAYNASSAAYGPTTSGMETAKVFGKALIPTSTGLMTTAGGQIIPALLKGVGAVGTAEAQKSAGETANAADNFTADQLITQAGQDRAAGQRGMVEEIRQMKLAQGRAQAVAAASGGGALDTSVMDIMGDLETQGRYKGDVAMYEGESSARNKETGAALARFSGKQALQAGNIASVSTLLSGASDLYSKYGGTSYGWVADHDQRCKYWVNAYPTVSTDRPDLRFSGGPERDD